MNFARIFPQPGKKKSDPILCSRTPPQSNIDIYSTHTVSASTRIVTHSTNVDKRPHFYVIISRMTNISSYPKNPMPISINNSLSSINLHIDNPEYIKNRIRILIDTGAAMNTGSLECHLWVIFQCPEMVEECLQYGKYTVYDAIYVLAALDLKDTNQDIDHGKMTVVIHYKTPYIVQDRGPFILSFALGYDSSLRCVLGLSTLLSIGVAINLFL